MATENEVESPKRVKLTPSQQDAAAWPTVYRFAEKMGVKFPQNVDMSTEGALHLLWEASKSRVAPGV